MAGIRLWEELGIPWLTASLIKKVESCTQQMVRGEWIRAEHDRCVLVTHVVQNKEAWSGKNV